MQARLSALLLALAATGCASSVYEGRYAWADGWREGKVVSVKQPREVGSRHSFDCRYKMNPQAVETSWFAIVAVWDAGRTKRAVVPVADGSTWPTAEDLVYVNVRTCDVRDLRHRSVPAEAKEKPASVWQPTKVGNE